MPASGKSEELVLLEEDTYLIEAVVAHRPCHELDVPAWEYRTRWEGYGEEHDTWEPATSFLDSFKVDEYWKSREAQLRKQGWGAARIRTWKAEQEKWKEDSFHAQPRKRPARRPVGLKRRKKRKATTVSLQTPQRSPNPDTSAASVISELSTPSASSSPSPSPFSTPVLHPFPLRLSSR